MSLNADQCPRANVPVCIHSRFTPLWVKRGFITKIYPINCINFIEITSIHRSIVVNRVSSNCTYTHKLRWKHDWRNWRRLILDWLYPSQRLNTTNLLCTKLRAMFSNLAAYRVSPEQYIDSSVIQNQFYKMFLESILQIVDQDISQQHVLDEFGMPRRVCEAFSWSNLVNELKLHQIASML